MNLEKVKEFTKQVPWGDLATSDGHTVGVRPISGLAWHKNQLWCATGASSEKVAHLRKLPYAEYSFCDAEGRHIRIAGHCTISSDDDEKLWLYKAIPLLKDYFPDPKMPEYVVIKMLPDKVRYMDVSDMAYKLIEIK